MGACALCGCLAPAAAHAILAALAEDDVDRALDLGLLDAPPCAGCARGCNTRLIAVRDERRRALAARERFRARQARLERRAREREAARTPPPTDAARPSAALPPAAAAALARALARAGSRKP